MNYYYFSIQCLRISRQSRSCTIKPLFPFLSRQNGNDGKLG